MFGQSTTNQIKWMIQTFTTRRLVQLTETSLPKVVIITVKEDFTAVIVYLMMFSLSGRAEKINKVVTST